MDPPVIVRVPFVDLKAHHESLKDELRAAVDRVFEQSGFILGHEVARFEQAFAAYLGVAHAAGVGSGFDALRLALVALGLGPGDEVIVPANTYIATALAVSAVGARPVLVDVEEERFGLDARAMEKALTPRTRAVIPVHLYGAACAMDGVLEVARRAGLFVVEDACQSHGATWKGQRCGTLGDVGCFSFYPSKNLGAAGDGGMVVTARAELDERIRLLRDYGQARKYHHAIKGGSARLDALQAAILGVKLPRLDGWNRSRGGHAALYDRLLDGIDGVATSPPVPDHVFHLYVIRARGRDALADYLRAEGVQTGIHYPVPIHLQPAYQDLGYAAGDFPISERLAGEILSLPMYPELTAGQVNLVARRVRDFYQASGRATGTMDPRPTAARTKE